MKIRTMDDATIRQVVAGLTHVQAEVSVELQRQLAKWGVQSHAPLSWLGILGEEVGEACKAAIEWGLHTSTAESREALRAELIQVAAVAIAAAECLDRTLVDEGEE